MPATKEKPSNMMSDEEAYEAFLVYIRKMNGDLREAVKDLPPHQQEGFFIEELTFDEFVQRIWYSVHRPRWEKKISPGEYERELEAIGKALHRAFANLKPSEYVPNYCI